MDELGTGDKVSYVQDDGSVVVGVVTQVWSQECVNLRVEGESLDWTSVLKDGKVYPGGGYKPRTWHPLEEAVGSV